MSRFDLIRKLIRCCGLALSFAQAQSISVGPFQIQFATTADSTFLPSNTALVIASGPDPAQGVPFQYCGTDVIRGGVDFVTVTPTSGVTRATVQLGLNYNVVPYLNAGTYILSAFFAPKEQAGCSGGRAASLVTLSVRDAPPPVISAVLNAATFQPAISPGTIVSVFGSYLSTPPQVGQPDANGTYPTSLGNTVVGSTTIPNDNHVVQMPILFVSQGQVNTVVPFALAGQASTVFGVGHGFQSASAPPTLALADTSPGIFTANQTGTAQGAILNADCTNPAIVTLNGTDHPAPRGCAVSIFATGAGVWTPALQDGRIVSIPDIAKAPVPAATVSLTIGGVPAQIRDPGAAPGLVAGVLQVNAIVPDGIAAGTVPVVLTIGRNDNAQQKVTMVVQ
jgi:uncharacterized protein (TIGR03437 family)